jgi:hypothetical protein
MKIPKLIGLVDSLRSTHTTFQFDKWTGTDPELVNLYLAHKINDIIRYLTEAPQIPNELPTKVKRDGDVVVHEHRWKKVGSIGTHGLFECEDCGSTKEQML